MSSLGLPTNFRLHSIPHCFVTISLRRYVKGYGRDISGKLGELLSHRSQTDRYPPAKHRQSRRNR